MLLKIIKNIVTIFSNLFFNIILKILNIFKFIIILQKIYYIIIFFIK